MMHERSLRVSMLLPYLRTTSCLLSPSLSSPFMSLADRGRSRIRGACFLCEKLKLLMNLRNFTAFDSVLE